MANPRGQIRDKPFRDALRLELLSAGEDHRKLRVIARNMIALACKNEPSAMAAIKELADRIDGKVPQGIVGDDEHPAISVKTDVSELEAARRIAFVLRSALAKQIELEAVAVAVKPEGEKPE